MKGETDPKFVSGYAPACGGEASWVTIQHAGWELRACTGTETLWLDILEPPAVAVAPATHLHRDGHRGLWPNSPRPALPLALCPGPGSLAEGEPDSPQLLLLASHFHKGRAASGRQLSLSPGSQPARIFKEGGEFPA